MLILAGIVILLAFTFGAMVTLALNCSAARMMVKLNSTITQDQWPMEVEFCNSLCRKSSARLIEKVLQLPKVQCDKFPIFSAEQGRRVLAELGLNRSINDTIALFTAMDIYDMCKADSNIQPFKVDPLDSTVIGQVNPGNLLLSAKVCYLDISTEMCVNEWSPTCNSACTLHINQLQLQKRTQNNCFKVSHSCQAFSTCRQLRFVFDMEQYDAEFLEHRASELSMSFSGNNTIKVMAGFETRIIFGGESALLTPLDASD